MSNNVTKSPLATSVTVSRAAPADGGAKATTGSRINGDASKLERRRSARSLVPSRSFMAESESEMGFFTRTDSGSSLNEVLNQEFTHSKSRKSKQAAEPVVFSPHVLRSSPLASGGSSKFSKGSKTAAPVLDNSSPLSKPYELKLGDPKGEKVSVERHLSASQGRRVCQLQDPSGHTAPVTIMPDCPKYPFLHHLGGELALRLHAGQPCPQTRRQLLWVPFRASSP
mmetsp:Transcript_5820/g.17406  ORF Transcript_5820/g.17406 Transcript_5820/m.17406 type:complete len:226 (-) Transcript_5820:65-742(-)